MKIDNGDICVRFLTIIDSFITIKPNDLYSNSSPFFNFYGSFEWQWVASHVLDYFIVLHLFEIIERG